MNLVAKTELRILLSMTASDLLALSNSLNEVCNGAHLSGAEFQSRMGVTRGEALATLAALRQALDAELSPSERCDAWSDGGSVMVKAITVHGDPVELGEREAQEFSAKLALATREAK